MNLRNVRSDKGLILGDKVVVRNHYSKTGHYGNFLGRIGTVNDYSEVRDYYGHRKWRFKVRFDNGDILEGASRGSLIHWSEISENLMSEILMNSKNKGESMTKETVDMTPQEMNKVGIKDEIDGNFRCKVKIYGPLCHNELVKCWKDK